MFEAPHLDHLHDQLDLAVVPLVEPQPDDAVGDVLDETVREDRGLSSFTSAVKMHVASVDLSCLQRANSFSRRSLSSAKSMFNKLIESIATRDAPLRLMKSGSSERIRVTVVFASAGSSLTMWSFFSLMYLGKSHPNDAAFAMTESASSSREMKMAFSPLIKPCIKNCSANVVFPVPKEPRTVMMCPVGTPRPSISSRPSMPVSTNPPGCPLSPASVAAGAASVSAIVPPQEIRSMYTTTRP